LITVLLGLAAVPLFHIQPAISPIQILAIDVVAQILPITALGWDKPLANLMHEKPRNLRNHIINSRAISGFVGFGALAAGLSYANYLFFFFRHHLGAAYIDPANPLYIEATTLTYLTLVLCLYVYLMFERADAHEKFFSSYLWSNKKLLIAFAASFVLIGNIIYNPWIRPYFTTGKLTVLDWLTALGFAAIYMLIRLLQRHTRKHSRRAVLQLHHSLHATNS
jgi:Ca2+-transporting ATPase